MKYTFIETDEQMRGMCEVLNREKRIGVDLEGDSLHCFKEKICLLQIATAKEAFLIDPFIMKDVSDFIRVLENPDIIKIFHGADFDIRSLDRDYGARVNNLFDTEIASRFLGTEERGLAALLKNHFNVIADKKFQRVDWSKRPLKEDMIAYSVGDVEYLTRLHTILTDKLTGIGRHAWAKEEFEIQEQVRYEHNYELPLFRRFKGAGRLDNRSLAVLENLLQLRLEIAEKKDRPLFKVIGNASLLTMACEKPNSIGQMVRIRALSQRQADMYGKKCLKAVAEAVNLPHGKLPSYPKTRRPKKDNRVLARIKRLKKMRENESLALGIEPGFLLNNALITAVAVNNPGNRDELAAIEGIRRWQVEALGESIMNAIG